jgi:hypothetical protein
VVEVCDACGQLMVSSDDSLSRMEVRVDTPLGPLLIGDEIASPSGPMSVEEASAWLEKQYYVPVTRGLGGEMFRAMFFLVLLGPLVVWLGAVTFVVSFLNTVIEGPAEVVRNTPGYDMTKSPSKESSAPAKPDEDR